VDVPNGCPNPFRTGFVQLGIIPTPRNGNLLENFAGSKIQKRGVEARTVVPVKPDASQGIHELKQRESGSLGNLLEQIILRVGGALTVGTSTATGILAPGIGTTPGTLTALSRVTFAAASSYKVDANSTTGRADNRAFRRIVGRSPTQFRQSLPKLQPAV
jgi:hypothetical protein